MVRSFAAAGAARPRDRPSVLRRPRAVNAVGRTPPGP